MRIHCDGKNCAAVFYGLTQFEQADWLRRLAVTRERANIAGWSHVALNTDLCPSCTQAKTAEEAQPVRMRTVMRIYVISDTQIAEWSPDAFGMAQMNELAVRKLLGDEGNAWFHQELADKGSVLLTEFRAKMASVS